MRVYLRIVTAVIGRTSSWLSSNAQMEDNIMRLLRCLITALCTIVQRTVLRPTVCLSVCDVGGSGSHRLEIWETDYTRN